MLNKLAFGLVIGAVTVCASAQMLTNASGNENSSAYVQNTSNVIMRSEFGLCWRTGYWTATNAVLGCDGELAPPIAKPTAPPIPTAMTSALASLEIAQALATASPTVALQCDFAVALENKQTFGFDKTLLNDEAKKRIDTELFSKLAMCSKVDLVLVTGYADRLGTRQYNRKLSEQRANNVATYLKNKGIASPIETFGAGDEQLIESCDGEHKNLIECLAPNRRVVVEVHGFIE